MKRRAILAGLLAAALVALAVVLASSGGGGPETEIIQGKPFTGNSGVSRTVAGITARHRYLERHPAVAAQEAEAESAAAADEAVRKEEAGSPGEAAAQEVDSNVREKPEPGEEGLPPRAVGPAAPQQRVGRAAIG